MTRSAVASYPLPSSGKQGHDRKRATPSSPNLGRDSLASSPSFDRTTHILTTPTISSYDCIVCVWLGIACIKYRCVAGYYMYAV
jgi:hypothetical protein